MGFHKHYLTHLLCACAPENQFAQDAIEHCIVCDHLPLTFDMESDVALIMRQYDEIILCYRRHLNQC